MANGERPDRFEPDGNLRPGGRRRERARHRYHSALVEFAYVVDGQEYHNTMPEPGTTQALAEAEVARYPVRTTLEIYYNPQNPTASALQKRDAITLDGRASLVVGFISLALAVYLVWN